MDQKELNDKHSHNPEPGDYWHDRFCPCYLVIDVSVFSVTVLSKKLYVNKAGDWTWDTSNYEVLSKRDFRKKLEYSSIPGTWANVVPNWKHWKEFAEEAMREAL